MKRIKKDNELFYSYINIKNNPTKIQNKNRGIITYDRRKVQFKQINQRAN